MSDHPLEPSPARFREWLDALANFTIAHIERLPQRHAGGLAPELAHVRAQEVRAPIGETPLPGGVDAIVDRLERAAEAALLTAGPGYLAYVPGGGLPTAALGDFVADLVNRFTGLTQAAPALARLEADVLEWLAAEFGYDGRARGLLCSGGSLANLSAVVTARIERLDEHADLRKATVYASSQAHHSIGKALRMAGLPRASLRTVEVDARLRLRPDALAERIAADRGAGLQPFLVVSAAGTTNTGAIDPLAEIAALSAREGLWHHVDAAYGGSFVLCDEGRARLAGIERADSITFDPHKGMFLPYGTGCLLVRDGAALRRAHADDAAYLQDFEAHDPLAAPSPAEHGPELSRPFRGLRLWLPLMLHGAAPFRQALTEKLELADRFHRGLVRLVDAGAPLEVVDTPQLSTVPFRLRRLPEETPSRHDARNAAWLRAINERGRVFLSSTSLPTTNGSAFTLRACILSFRTHETHVDHALEDVEHTLPGSAHGKLPLRR
ncbi:pyridoxal phosphate-dependent decarboxylase family protein [Paraliomyxa miuraensis]|uniref:pyridoxal phosphate-dependent decarboxylase family protein n=1 Tax=Paraliomyxa miuraensis TaxID=376150 RepID=UPI00225708C5|nr:pyridoxal-dependent decarboxylase [Paraliomyxa miuraensis]MCX4243520.1 pyridoxal-dependent decarboxylase [Paraliomyxa miuraensis]